jgi:hypothetical protein
VRGLGSLTFVRAPGRTLQEPSLEKVLALLWMMRRAPRRLNSRAIRDIEERIVGDSQR